MQVIENQSIRRESKSLQLIHKFPDDLFTELAGKFQYDAGMSKEDAERAAILRIREIYSNA